MALDFPYQTVLVLGATSGIGLALAEKLISNGSHVIAVGRRQENLNQLQQEHGKEKVSIYQFDVNELEKIPKFVDEITTTHPTLSSIILNSGIQRRLDFTSPSTIDLLQVTTELTTNYLSPLHFTTAFLPHLQYLSKTQNIPTSLIFTTSGLALIPILRCPNYCASKAAMHHLILCLREQLKSTDGDVGVIEILPPAVQTELHDSKHQPDLKDGGGFGMPLDEFTEEAWRGLCKGETDIAVGMANMSYEGWERERQGVFRAMVEKGAGKL
ncbi:NAD(P)-binding protein [Cadophora sp. DSE1049]|nr:NAD(P)-binding protein [Cadophora sp. DSE1049]